MSAARHSRLPRWQEWAVYVSLGLLIASGIGWLIFDQWVRIPGEFGSEYHPAQHWALIVHGIAAYAFLLVIGALIPVHIRLGWSIGRNRQSGLALAGMSLLLAATALGLYYLGGEGAREWASVIHWIVGVAVLPVILVHAISGRRGT